MRRPDWNLGALVDRLTEEESRLDQLTAGDLRTDAAFATSYRRLDPATQLVFRRLALLPGGDASPVVLGLQRGTRTPAPVDAVTAEVTRLVRKIVGSGDWPTARASAAPS